MHRLYESVCPMVEEATRADEDPAVTFVRVRKRRAHRELGAA